MNAAGLEQHAFPMRRCFQCIEGNGGVMNSRAVLLALLLMTTTMGCGSFDNDSHTDSQYENLSFDVCPDVNALGSIGYLIDSSRIAIICQDAPSSRTSRGVAVFSFDIASRKSTLIYHPLDVGFLVIGMRNNVLYITPAERPGSALEALRLDAGPTLPSTVIATTSLLRRTFGIADSYVYWMVEDLSHTLTRAPIAGGPEEPIAMFPFDVYDHLVLSGDDVYVLGLPGMLGGNQNVAIAHASISSRSVDTIFSEPPGGSEAPWLVEHQGHVIFSDNSAVPPKTYSIEASGAKMEPSLICPFDSRSAFSEGGVLSFNFAACAPPEDGLAVTDLRARETKYYRDDNTGHLRVAALIGVRDGWIYWTSHGPPSSTSHQTYAEYLVRGSMVAR